MYYVMYTYMEIIVQLQYIAQKKKDDYQMPYCYSSCGTTIKKRKAKIRGIRRQYGGQDAGD